MKRILFFIHDLGQGGAEKVLVNLVNNLDRSKFDVSVTVLFGGGVNERFLKDDIHFRSVFKRMIPANVKFMKLFSPTSLHKKCVKDRYDIEISYLQGPSARVIAGCADPNVKKVSWIHTDFMSAKSVAFPFRNFEEAKKCYDSFDRTVCVSKKVKDTFCRYLSPVAPVDILYNTVESNEIIKKSKEAIEDDAFLSRKCLKLIAMGSLKPVKGFDRLLRVVKRLREQGLEFHLYILGIGPSKKEHESYISQNSLNNYVTLLGYKLNPYKYLAKSDIFVCSSLAEGFSTAATESLIVGTPVCTVDVSGMREMLGENNEYGIVTENTEEALYEGIKSLLDDPSLLAHYKQKAAERGRSFSTENTVKAVEKMLLDL